MSPSVLSSSVHQTPTRRAGERSSSPPAARRVLLYCFVRTLLSVRFHHLRGSPSPLSACVSVSPCPAAVGGPVALWLCAHRARCASCSLFVSRSRLLLSAVHHAHCVRLFVECQCPCPCSLPLPRRALLPPRGSFTCPSMISLSPPLVLVPWSSPNHVVFGSSTSRDYEGTAICPSRLLRLPRRRAPVLRLFVSPLPVPLPALFWRFPSPAYVTQQFRAFAQYSLKSPNLFRPPVAGRAVTLAGHCPRRVSAVCSRRSRHTAHVVYCL